MNIVTLGTRTLSKYYSPDENLYDVIMARVNSIESVFEELATLDTTYSDRLSVRYQGETLDSITNQYRLLLNDFINDPEKDETKSLLFLREKVYPVWHLFID